MHARLVLVQAPFKKQPGRTRPGLLHFCSERVMAGGRSMGVGGRAIADRIGVIREEKPPCRDYLGVGGFDLYPPAYSHEGREGVVECTFPVRFG
jgi:hypothetical protein